MPFQLYGGEPVCHCQVPKTLLHDEEHGEGGLWNRALPIIIPDFQYWLEWFVDSIDNEHNLQHYHPSVHRTHIWLIIMSSAQDTTPSSNSKLPEPRGKGVLFGYPISHSLAPLLHNTVFGGLNLPWDFDFLESKDIEEFLLILRSTECYGRSTRFFTTKLLLTRIRMCCDNAT
jgi:hypothetical protein